MPMSPAEDDSDTDEETKTDNARGLASPLLTSRTLDLGGPLPEVKTTNEDGKTEIRVIRNGTKPQKHVSTVSILNRTMIGPFA